MIGSVAKVSDEAVTCPLPLPLLSPAPRARPPVRVKCSPDDTVGDLKKLIAAQTGTSPEKVRVMLQTVRCSH